MRGPFSHARLFASPRLGHWARRTARHLPSGFGMRMRWAVLAGLLALGLAQGPPPEQVTPSNDEIRELQARLDTLQQEIDQLAAAQSPEQRQTLMQRSWRSMQEYMGWMHSRWGMGGPWMMGRGGGMMQGPGATSCPMLGGSSANWPVPEGVSPEQYGREMSEHMKQMHEQMAQIAQTADPKQRERLLQEHWQTMYRQMETMRGRGWMWGGPMMSREPPHLPEPDSAGAKLVSEYCTHCHAAPPPALHTSQEWASVLARMDAHMVDAGAGVRLPEAGQLQTILAYMQKHAG
jgi:hypothetical protein